MDICNLQGVGSTTFLQVLVSPRGKACVEEEIQPSAFVGIWSQNSGLLVHPPAFYKEILIQVPATWDGIEPSAMKA